MPAAGVVCAAGAGARVALGVAACVAVGSPVAGGGMFVDGSAVGGAVGVAEGMGVDVGTGVEGSAGCVTCETGTISGLAAELQPTRQANQMKRHTTNAKRETMEYSFSKTSMATKWALAHFGL